MKYTVKQVPYYGFDHKKVIKQLEGNLSFCNEFCILQEYCPTAIYKAKNPNKKKGHKKYVLLQITEVAGQQNIMIRGMTSKQMSKERYQHAILCKICNTVLYSMYRHHMNSCGCSNATNVDGGKQYLKYGASDMSKVEVVTLDLITNKIVKR
jgi:hypothetical protein